jgi:hypothetical protein
MSCLGKHLTSFALACIGRRYPSRGRARCRRCKHLGPKLGAGLLGLLVTWSVAPLTACTHVPMRKASPAPEPEDVPISLTTSLPPASGELNVSARRAETVSDVRVTAMVGIWPGGEAVFNRVTPVKVLIENKSDQPLRINYESMRIRGGPGDYYAALPPYSGMRGRRVLGTGLQQVGFTVAQSYQRIYPSLRPHAGRRASSKKAYISQHSKYWERVGQPTPPCCSMRCRRAC